METLPETHYDTLQVDPECTLAEVVDAYRRMVGFLAFRRGSPVSSLTLI